MEKFKLFALGILLMISFASCDNDSLVSDEGNINEAISEPRCPPGGCGPAVELCEILCLNGGFKITVHEHQPGVHRYAYVPMNNIYVDHAYHSQNYPISPTSNLYTYDYYLINNTNPNAPWKDVNGNVIMGPVYSYTLKNPQCFSYFFTSLLYGLTNPCDMNSALLHLNQSSNKPSGCGHNGGSNIICPSGPITNIPQVDHKLTAVIKTTIITNKYGRLCNEDQSGLCFVGMKPVDPETPQIGPVTYTHMEEQNSIKVKFWRSPETSVLEVYEGENEISEEVKTAFLLPEEAKFSPGSYEIQEDDLEFGFVILELEY